MPEKSKQQLATDRTELAFHRNLLAEQRTFSAWMRTGIAAIALGFADIKLLAEAEPKWAVYAAGVILIVIGMAIHILSFWGYYVTFRALKEEGLPGLPIWSVVLITLSLFIAGLLILILLLAGLIDSP
ncbi:Protein of unknown function DUF202 [Nitrosococcus oceani ATCC 19707]|uniref:DUF202 domain-containing protein n=2 Tax=Nitrosococcus oceani TaxID=1229 RepID=Q3JDW1_NITOC|nr:DUF202 domain-containing protein [Nitrosococcus oceani]ABA56985.1 Protein of unknown function DUF202 [Nitrosococcus oceani ATCC 19707]EDZ66494.1 conserved domain protein [Nitrosococcus oceani AFC27]KFI20561.1 hypothetical protein IB75_02400 [Nitrosococcus oceani C-27]GEM20910.1 hypothetical protein NONS58_23340 [Nitrosococcus oceani]